MDDCPVDLLPTRSSLLGRLKSWDDNESWRDFFETYWRLIYAFARQRGLDHEEAQEVVQETVVAVAKGIRDFKYQPQVCAFKTWLLTVTRNKIINQMERRSRRPVPVSSLQSDNQSTDLLNRAAAATGDPWEQTWEDEWQKNLMEVAVNRVKKRVSIEQFQMFDLFVLKQWPARDVAKTLGVTIGHVYVAKHRLSKLVKAEFEALSKKGD
jgi:RNA polymerase sigma factor (sigma-70 family)